MADTKTAEALSQEVKKKDFGIYNQGRIKLNYNEETQDWSEQYEPVKGYKMFIPPVPQQVKLPTDVTVPETPAVDTPTTEITQPATPIVQPRDSGESLYQKQQREMMERFGPGQDPMQTANRIASIFTPGTEQYSYYKSMGALDLNENELKVNFDMIDEKGGYGLPSLLGGTLKFAEKDIIQNTINKLRYAGIIEGSEIEDSKGMYTFNVNKDKFNSYVENAPKVADLLRGNREILEQLGKLDRDEVDEFVADMAIGMADDNKRNVIENALQGKTKGAAAALIAFQTGEELDLNKKGFFGNNFYSDQFKEDYTRTLQQLQQTQEEEVPEEQPSDIDVREIVSARKEEQRQQSDSMKKTFDALVEQAKKADDPQVKTSLLNQASAYSGAGDIAEPTEDGKQFPSSYGGVYQGDTKKTSTSSGNKSSQGLTSKQKEAIAGSSSNKSSNRFTKRAAPVKKTLTGGKLAGTEGYTRGR